MHAIPMPALESSLLSSPEINGRRNGPLRILYEDSDSTNSNRSLLLCDRVLSLLRPAYRPILYADRVMTESALREVLSLSRIGYTASDIARFLLEQYIIENASRPGAETQKRILDGPNETLELERFMASLRGPICCLEAAPD